MPYPSRAEITRRLPCIRNGNIRRQESVHRTRQTFRRDASVRKEIHHLPAGMHTRVRAAGSGKLHCLPAYLRECCLEGVLHGNNRR